MSRLPIVAVTVATCLAGCGSICKGKTVVLPQPQANLLWEFIYERGGPDQLFVARRTPAGAGGEKAEAVRPSEIWRRIRPEDDSEKFSCPAGSDLVAMYSKGAYNGVQWVAILPPLSDVLGTKMIYLGMEHSGGFKWGLASFRLKNRKFVVEVGALRVSREVDITSLLPPDYDSAYHRYAVLHLGPAILFLIDSKIVAIAVNGGDWERRTPVIPPPPYGLVVSPVPVATRLSMLAEAAGRGEELGFWLPYRGAGAVAFDRPPPLSLDLHLWASGAKLAGYRLEAGDALSHPFPALGFSSISILFEASQAGTLRYEVMTREGNWEPLDAVPVEAERAVLYRPPGEALMGRVAFMPSGYPCTIKVAEVHLVP